MPSKVDEDLVFLLENCSLTDPKLKAWEHVLRLTTSEEGLSYMILSGIYLPCILKHLQIGISDSDSRKNAHKCLINIASKGSGTSALLQCEKALVLQLITAICNSKVEFPEEKCYILSNLSANCNLLQEDNVLPSLPGFMKGIKMFFFSNDPSVRDKYKFLALVFGNISKQPEGRRILIEDDTFLADAVVCLNPSENSIRRLGIALTYRNCCCETDCHKRLLEDIQLLPVMLLPLMGPEEFEEEEMDQLPLECQYLENSKTREEKPQVRRALVQALSLLCYSEEGWSYLKSNGVYYVARELHKWEQDSCVIEAIETLVAYMLVEQYTTPEASDCSLPAPSETDILKDVPDIVL